MAAGDISLQSKSLKFYLGAQKVAQIEANLVRYFPQSCLVVNKILVGADLGSARTPLVLESDEQWRQCTAVCSRILFYNLLESLFRRW